MIRALQWVAVMLIVAEACASELPPPAGLVAALEKISEGSGRWAYTETHTRYEKDGTIKDETIVRIDPSKPYAQQSVPLKIRNRPPSESDLKKYRERGEKKADKIERAERLGTPLPRKKPLTEILHLEQARLLSETPTTATYLIPLREPKKKIIPVEKLEFHVRLNKASQVVENISVQLLDSFRVKAVAKIKAGAFNAYFTSVNPDFPPVCTRIEGHAAISFLLIPMKQTLVVTRTDFRRVKPYDERFEVQLGPTEVIDF